MPWGGPFASSLTAPAPPMDFCRVTSSCRRGATLSPPIPLTPHQDWKSRLTIAQSMEHPWASGATEVPDANLSTAMVAMRRMTAARRFKKVT